jgi:hypothetical protein
VLALAINSGLVTYPAGYSRAWAAEGVTLWRPQPQPGYRALGLVTPPPPPRPALPRPALRCRQR